MLPLAARLLRSSLAELRLVGVGGTLGISSACIARPSLNGATAALHAEGSRTAAASLLIAAVATPAPSTGPLASALLPRMPASGAAAASLGRRSDGIVGTLPRPSLGASMRFASTATAAEAAAAGGKTNDAPAAVAVVPSAVLVKVGDGGIWNPFEHEKLLRMNRSNLLEALAGSKMFAFKFKDVDLSACSIAVIKNAALPAGVKLPPAALETGDALVEMEGTMTVGDMANDFGASGAPFFVRVGLPPTVHADSTKIDTSSPETMCASLRRLVPAPALRNGHQLLQLRCLTSTPFLSGVTVEQASASLDDALKFLRDIEPVRGQSVAAVGAAFALRRQNRAMAAKPAERQMNPLVALQSAPGGGKSAMLDTLALLSSKGLWAERHCGVDAGMQDALNRSIPIPVTYNSGSEVSLTRHDADIEGGLALRILHSFFIDSKVMAFDEFCVLFPKGLPSAAQAVRACLLAAKRETGSTRGVLLLVDEIAKLLLAEPNAPLLTVLGGLLDTFSSDDFNLVCTTLDAVMLKEKITPSGRGIVWAPLPAIERPSAEQLMLRALQRVDAAATKLPLEVRITISDAAGHPRSLQHVLQAMLDVRSRKVSDKDPAPLPPLQVLRNNVLARFKSSNIDTPSFAAIQAALRGLKLPLSSMPLGDGKTLHALVAIGVFINTDVEAGASQSLVPKLSMLRLLQYAREHVSSKDWRLKTASVAIEAMAREEAGGADTAQPSLTGEPFEKFMTRWLQLATAVWAGTPVSVMELFHADDLESDTGAGGAANLALTTHVILDNVTLQDASPLSLAKALRRPSSKLKLTGGKGGIIQQFGGSNPAFDILLTAPCSSDPESSVAVAIETRMSDVGNRGEKEMEIPRKIALFDDVQGRGSTASSVPSLLKRLHPSTAHVAYVYAAARPVRKIFARQKEECKRGILLLGNSCPGETASVATVQRALTDTLADRAFFLLEPK